MLRRRARVPARPLRAFTAGVFITAVVVRVVGWWAGAHRFAVGYSGDWLFLRHSQWSPPLGWWPWLLLMATAAAAYLAAGVVYLQAPRIIGQQAAGGDPHRARRRSTANSPKRRTSA